jgi:membrane-bound serine protease (ClpP class)
MELVIVLLLMGVVLLLLETILPGMIAGTIGLACIAAGVALSYERLGTPTAHYILVGVIVGLVIGTFAWLKYFPRSRLVRPLVSKSAVGEIGTERPELLDQTGTAFTQLRPAGTALINGHRVDVVSEGTLIEPGTPVRVVAVEGIRVVVRAIQ